MDYYMKLRLEYILNELWGNGQTWMCENETEIIVFAENGEETTNNL